MWGNPVVGSDHIERRNCKDVFAKPVADCDDANRLTAFNGQTYGYGDGGPYHAVDRIGGNDRFDYDANGNMTARNKGLASQQTLVWDAQNWLYEAHVRLILTPCNGPLAADE